MINNRLAIELEVSPANRSLINLLHNYRDLIFDEMRIISNRLKLRVLDCELDMLEESLQGLWGFGIDKNYVKFWNRPKCTCPKMDNIDNYPHGGYTVRLDCPLHGDELDRNNI